MKILNVILATLTLSFTATSFAQDAAEEESQKQPAVAAPAEEGTATKVDAGNGTTTPTVAEATKDAKASKWKMAYNFRATYGRADAANSTGDISNRNRFTFGYKFDAVTLALKPTWFVTHNVASEVSTVKAGDLILEASNGTKLNHGWDLATIGRYYFPTSEASKNLSSDGMAYLELYVTKPLSSRYTAIVDVVGTRNLHNYRAAYSVKNEAKKKTTPTSSKPTPVGELGVGDIQEVKANVRDDFHYYGAIDYKINKTWSISQWIGYGNTTKYSSPAQNIQPINDDLFELYTFLAWEPSKNYNLTLGLVQERNKASRAAKKDFTFLNDQETSYFLDMVVSL